MVQLYEDTRKPLNEFEIRFQLTQCGPNLVAVKRAHYYTLAYMYLALNLTSKDIIAVQNVVRIASKGTEGGSGTSWQLKQSFKLLIRSKVPSALWVY